MPRRVIGGRIRYVATSSQARSWQSPTTGPAGNRGASPRVSQLGLLEFAARSGHGTPLAIPSVGVFA